MNKSILLKTDSAIKAHQMAMAKNIARLATKTAQKQQAHLLCESLKQSIAARA